MFQTWSWATAAYLPWSLSLGAESPSCVVAGFPITVMFTVVMLYRHGKGFTVNTPCVKLKYSPINFFFRF